jgi:hypothetical protein
VLGPIRAALREPFEIRQRTRTVALTRSAGRPPLAISRRTVFTETCNFAAVSATVRRNL